MLIYFNGDSNIGGEELASKKQGMAAQLAARFDAEYINPATSGASNDLIYDQTMRYFEDPHNLKPDLVVIGWTEFNRIQWYLTDQWGHSRLWEINHLGVGIPVPEQYQKRHQHWKDNIVSDGHWNRALSDYWHNKIYNVHCMLTRKGIPHLFFNAFNHFKKIHDRYELPWDESFLSPYSEELIYTKWCLAQGYNEITPGYMHFPPEAHAAWADVMYTHIKTHKLI